MNLKDEIARIDKQMRWHYGAIAALKLRRVFFKALLACGIKTVWEVPDRPAEPSVVERAHRIANGKDE